MKKSNKELLYLKAIIMLTVVMVFLCGCAKVEIMPKTETYALELDSTLSEDVADTTAPELILMNDKFVSEADLIIPVDSLYEKIGVTVADLSEVNTTLSVVSGEAEVREDGSLYLKTEGEIFCEVTATDAYNNASTAEFTIVATEPTYPEFAEDYTLGFYMTLDDDSDMTESIIANDKKDGELSVTLDESNLDRSVEGEYIITANARDSDGREISVEVPIKVLDMSYIDTEDKAMFFALLVDNDDMEDIKDSVWSKELGKKYGVPKEDIKGYKPSAEQPEVSTEVPVPTSEEGYRDDLAQQMFAMINEYRVQNGVAELAWNNDIASASKTRAVEISQSFSHTRPNGGKAWDICDLVYGENIEMNSSGVECGFEDWQQSPPHNEAMLSGEYVTAGLGCYYKNGIYYFVQLFGY